jgi:hypothetical protein
MGFLEVSKVGSTFTDEFGGFNSIQRITTWQLVTSSSPSLKILEFVLDTTKGPLARE